LTRVPRDSIVAVAANLFGPQKASSEQSQTISDAIQDIEKLLGGSERKFYAPSVKLAAKATKSGTIQFIEHVCPRRPEHP
jgi:hypothetical protein